MRQAARQIVLALCTAIAGLGAIVPHGAGAAPVGRAPVALDSAIYVERREDLRRVLEPADRLHPGDRVVTVVTWKRAPRGPSAGSGFTVTNPLPRALAYQGSGADAEEVSIDGGHSWGQLGALRIGQRRATPEDVTHVRWRVASPAPVGRIAYSAIVR